MRTVIAATVFLTVCGVTAAQQRGPSGPATERSEFVWVDVTGGRIGGRAYINAGSDDRPVLVVVLHGDLLEPNNSYHYGFARTVADASSNVVAVGLLRPGYSDERGNRSDGDILNATGDNYTADVVDAVATATRQMRSRYRARAALLIGHSGGAAIAALVLGRHPDAADGGLLVACPCDLPAWRSHMMTVRPSPIWQQPHKGLSPMDAAPGVRPASVVRLVVGDQDDVVRPKYSQDYADALRQRKVDATVAILPGLGHNILQRPAVIDMANALIRSIQSSR
jgi:pimeloyl-ACP methyl ester carboxylesterase